jgi:membrane associated rhomboid family serine protease
MLYFFFYYPLGLDLRGTRQVWMSWALIVASGVGFLAAALVPAWFWSRCESLAYVPARPSLVALVANSFFHADWLHLLSNMIALAVLGPPLEERLGAWRLLAFYVAFNICGNLVQGAAALVFLPDTARHGVLGASGAIAGLLGLILVRLHFARLRVGYWAFLPLQAYARAGTNMLPVGVAAALWFLTQAAVALAQAQGGETQIAVGSHLGGLCGGVALGMAMGLRRDAAAEHHLHRGRRYLGAAQWFPAQGEFIQYVQQRPTDPEGHLELARTYRLTAQHRGADAHYRRACELLARSGRVDGVEAAHGEALRGNPDFVLPPMMQLQLAQFLERACKRDLAEQVYRTYARIYADEGGAPLALFRAARLAESRRSSGDARELYDLLLHRHPDSPEAEMALLALAERKRREGRRNGTVPVVAKSSVQARL